MFVKLICGAATARLVAGLEVKAGGHLAPGPEADLLHNMEDFDMEGFISGVYGRFEAEPTCQDHSQGADTPVMLRTGVTTDVNIAAKLTEDLTGFDRHQAVAAMIAIGADIKKYCLGESWDGKKCHAGVDVLRKFSWSHLLRYTAKYPEFEHLRASNAAPPIKRFRAGGGMQADIPCRADGSSAHLFYRHIYKCAGMNIKKNLATNAGMWWGRAVDYDWRTHKRCDSYQRKRTPENFLFTFVRDPISKFIAGYKEIASRGLIDVLQGERVGTREHALAFLDNVFHGTCDNGHVLLQVQNLFGDACESKFDFIGRVERFDKDWERVGWLGGCDRDQPLSWNHTMTHESDDVDHGAQQAMEALLAENDGKLMLSLCFWVLPDIIAFGYSLPPACAENKMLKAVQSKTAWEEMP